MFSSIPQWLIYLTFSLLFNLLQKYRKLDFCIDHYLNGEKENRKHGKVKGNLFLLPNRIIAFICRIPHFFCFSLSFLISSHCSPWPDDHDYKNQREDQPRLSPFNRSLPLHLSENLPWRPHGNSTAKNSHLSIHLPFQGEIQIHLFICSSVHMY